MRKPRKLGLVIIAAGFALAVVVQLWPSAQPGAESGGAPAAAGSALPPFSWTAIDGRAVTSESAKGKVLLVNFWATWCAPCREEFPSLVALQARYQEDVMVLGMALDESPLDQIAAFAKEHDATFPIIVATGPDADLFGGVMGLPTTFVVSRNGRIVFSHTGYATAEIFEDTLKTALNAGGL